MERNFYTDDFEEFLKEKADQNKMYPSDRVWNNVYGSLHNRRRWFAIGLVLLLVTSALMVSREVLMTGKTAPIAQKTIASLPAAADNDNTPSYTRNIGIPAYKGVASQSNHIIHPTVVTAADIIPATVDGNTVNTDAAGNNTGGTPAGNFNTSASLATVRTEASQQVIDNIPAINTPDAAGEASTGSDAASRRTLVQPLPSFKANIAVSQTDKAQQDQFSTIHPNIPIRDKWSMKIYGSPMVSYRRLTDLNRTAKYVPVAISYSGNIDNYVHHKPAIGFELGTRIQYKLTPSLSVFSGLQFNYSRYYIDAYKSLPERATIALTSSSFRSDTLANYTSIRNFGGYAPEQLTNQYLQVSVPLGAELKLLGNDRIQLGIAAAVQPTYLLASSTYLISSDFKNYVENSDLVRRFNIHTNFEAFVSYESPASGLRWQLGPQFRYQVLSSYSNKYPIREYITEFGIKLGITRILKKK
ncbi:MAG TPA: hypothetical protein VLD19_07225 [Chitinophagaceae bacterium]|nr:hypothetical protein [Chitinophagaceae bacterium]